MRAKVEMSHCGVSKRIKANQSLSLWEPPANLSLSLWERLGEGKTKRRHIVASLHKYAPSPVLSQRERGIFNPPLGPKGRLPEQESSILNFQSSILNLQSSIFNQPKAASIFNLQSSIFNFQSSIFNFQLAKGCLNLQFSISQRLPQSSIFNQPKAASIFNHPKAVLLLLNLALKALGVMDDFVLKKLEKADWSLKWRS